MVCEKCGRLSPMSNPDAACVYCGHNPAVGALGGMPPGDPPVHVPSAGVFVPADSIEGELKVGYAECSKTFRSSAADPPSANVNPERFVGKHAAPVSASPPEQPDPLAWAKEWGFTWNGRLVLPGTVTDRGRAPDTPESWASYHRAGGTVLNSAGEVKPGPDLPHLTPDQLQKITDGPIVSFPRAAEKRNGVLVVNYPRGDMAAFAGTARLADQVEAQCGVRPVVCPRSGDSFPTVEWVEFGATRKYGRERDVSLTMCGGGGRGGSSSPGAVFGVSGGGVGGAGDGGANERGGL